MQPFTGEDWTEEALSARFGLAQHLESFEAVQTATHYPEFSGCRSRLPGLSSRPGHKNPSPVRQGINAEYASNERFSASIWLNDMPDQVSNLPINKNWACQSFLINIMMPSGGNYLDTSGRGGERPIEHTLATAVESSTWHHLSEAAMTNFQQPGQHEAKRSLVTTGKSTSETWTKLRSPSLMIFEKYGALWPL